MAPSEWQQVVELFNAALEKSAEERAALLDEACATDLPLRKAVEEMLKEHDSSDGFLSQPLLGTGAPLSRVLAVTAGDTFGRFITKELLGQGGMGEVWSARDTELDRDVALKFLQAESGTSLEVSNIAREARAASALNHPNIVTIHEVVRTPAGSAIVMELIRGDSLAKFRNGSLPIKQVLQAGLQTARALAAAHAHNIVHGDIKPENIMLRDDGYVKVLDFGLARKLSADVSDPERRLLGTLRYMSPEQAKGEKISPASDIFSFGLVLFELASGKHAFASESPLEVYQAIRSSNPLTPSSHNARVGKRLDALLLSMLAKDPALRPAAHEVVLHLDEIANGSEAAGLPAAAQPAKAQPSRKSWLLGLLAGGCLIVAGLAVWLRHDKSEPLNLRELKVRPLTSQSGLEASPAFSPDGDWVAFTWSERLGQPRQVYVKKRGRDELTKLTDQRNKIGGLAWAPDGKRIAFKSALEESGMVGAIYVVPLAGGKPEKMAGLANGNLTSSIDWSPDGKELAFSDAAPNPQQLAIYLLDVQTHRKRLLVRPPEGVWGDWDPRFSPDGRTVAFKRVRGFLADEIFLIPAAGGPLRRLAGESGGIYGHAWMPDGRALIASCQRSGTVFGLWRFPVTSRERPERVIQGGADAVQPASARGANRIAWVNQLDDVNVYRAPVNGVGPPEKFISSTLRDQHAIYAAGSRIAFISDRSGSREVWMAQQDGTGQVRATNFNGQYIDDIEWSHDGRRLALSGRVSSISRIFVLDCAPPGMTCGPPRQVTSRISGEVPAWSADDRCIYFTSGQSGRPEVWKVPESGGEARQITRLGGYEAHESADGHWLYFSKEDGAGIWRIRLSNGLPDSGREEVVLPPRYRFPRQGWVLTGQELFFIDQLSPVEAPAIRTLNLKSHQTRLVAGLPKQFFEQNDLKLSVSKDFQWVLYSQVDRSGNNIMLADDTN